jgi:hypothetical protein
MERDDWPLVPLSCRQHQTCSKTHSTGRCPEIIDGRNVSKPERWARYTILRGPLSVVR